MRVTIEGGLQDVVDIMANFPGGEPVVETNGGFQDDPGPDNASDWEFFVGDKVSIVATGETGFVQRKMRDLYAPDLFDVNFTSRTNGEAKRGWYPAAALVDIPLN